MDLLVFWKRKNLALYLKISSMKVHQGFCFEHRLISMQMFAGRERPKKSESIDEALTRVSEIKINLEMVMSISRISTGWKMIEMKSELWFPASSCARSPCSRWCGIVSVLKYNQVAENSYDQQFNFVKGTIYINEMISISEPKLICKCTEGLRWRGRGCVQGKEWLISQYLLWLLFMYFGSSDIGWMVGFSLVNGCYWLGQHILHSNR